MAGGVALIVVTYRSANVLPGFLAALPQALEGVDGAEVIAVDNASDDASARIAAESPAVDRLLVLDGNRGYAAGINAGIAAAPDRNAYLVLNPDVRLWPGSVHRLMEAAASPGVGIAVPRLLDEHGRLLPSLRREPSLRRAAGEAVLGGRRAGRWRTLGETIVAPEVYAAPTSAAWATGGAMLLSAECLRATGPWDESFFLYEEEVEFALRARDHGFHLVYAPDAAATRIIGDTPPSTTMWTLMRVNKWRLYARRHGPLRAGAFRLVLIAGEGIRALSGRPASRAAFRGLLSATAQSERTATGAPV